METNRPMRLLLIEDDAADALKYSEIAKSRPDINFIGMAASCEEGLKLIKSGLAKAIKSGGMIETPADRRERIYRRIDIELDLIGIRAKIKGLIFTRRYLYSDPF